MNSKIALLGLCLSFQYCLSDKRFEREFFCTNLINCKYPHEYCDIDDTTCYLCNVDVCNQPEVPVDCFHKCFELGKEIPKQNCTQIEYSLDIDVKTALSIGIPAIVFVLVLLVIILILGIKLRNKDSSQKEAISITQRNSGASLGIVCQESNQEMEHQTSFKETDNSL